MGDFKKRQMVELIPPGVGKTEQRATKLRKDNRAGKRWWVALRYGRGREHSLTL